MRELLPQNGLWLGPLLGGIALCVSAMAAWITYLLQRKIRQAERRDSYREMYTEFWKDDDNTVVRNWITNDVEYEPVKDVLKRRKESGKNNTLSAEHNKFLERIDRFCAFLIRVQYFEAPIMSLAQRRLWNRTFSDFWIHRIRARTELADYINTYWDGITLKPLDETWRQIFRSKLKQIRVRLGRKRAKTRS
jgi:hypothetical protein